MKFLLSTTYFGPIQYFSKLERAEEVLLEKYEHYPKQTYRNRCVICSANGPQTLSIPVLRGNELKIYTKDVRIDYAMNWQNNHIRAIESAYRCSPFYLYYIDDILPQLRKKHPFLYDYTMEVTAVMCKILGISYHLNETQEYLKIVPAEFLDFRDLIHPKPRMYKPDPTFIPPAYRQVFEPTYGFIPNASILDLVFNEGPEALKHLRDSRVQ
jgi:hypothetical protein